MNKNIRSCILIALWLIIVLGANCSNADSTSKSVPSLSSNLTSLSSVEHGCEWSETLPESRPSDFDLIFKYGYGTVNRNTLDTFDETYMKDLYADPPVTIDFRLSDGDMDRIYREMVEIDFFCYPNTFVIHVPDGGMLAGTANYQSYYFQVMCNQHIKVVQWQDSILNPNEDASNLRRLIDLITNIIESKAEYRELPSPRGAIS